jgi:hypothetical protein
MKRPAEGDLSRTSLSKCACVRARARVCADLHSRYGVSAGGCLLDPSDEYALISLSHHGLQFCARCHRTDETGLHRANGFYQPALLSVGSSDSILY